ncbi:hypothetical protein [Nonomuraea maheshkhaliensis]
MSVVLVVTVSLSYASTGKDSGHVIAISMLISAAAFVVGGLAGFLFALPRSLTAISERSSAGPSTQQQTLTVRANTNLEDVSDWLTKIIVGLTLTQLGEIPDGASTLFHTLGAALGDDEENAVFAGLLTVFCFTVGFIEGWLSTRTYIARWMAAADRPLRSTLRLGRTNQNRD